MKTKTKRRTYYSHRLIHYDVWIHSPFFYKIEVKHTDPRHAKIWELCRKSKQIYNVSCFSFKIYFLHPCTRAAFIRKVEKL